MEQSVNTFQQGLQMDSNPMVAGNQSLTDALNATFVTMNGNEIILQNDMGNRRVDHAYLPSGYTPVGIKEYGGIIYIASYNPITNRSQIGSFPSPERLISNADTKDGLGTDFKLKNFYDNSNVNENYIINDTYLCSLTSDTSLHVGDKFVLYGSGYYDNSSNELTQLTHYNQQWTNQNRLYTLEIGILNSQNEFVNITESLNRYDESGELISKDSNFENWFNSGYFILNTSSETSPKELTISDSQLENERNLAKFEGNTYAYKLVGPLYLKATLNHVYNVNYTIQGSQIEEGQYKIIITASIQYNCPNDNNRWFVLTKGLNQNDSGPNNEEISPPIYNTGTQLWETVQRKTYTINTNDYSWEYTLDIPAFYGEDKDIYIEGLSQSGTLDLSLLGSGKVNILGYRFYNNFENKTGIITLVTEGYPRVNETLNNLSIYFYPINAEPSYDNGLLVAKEFASGRYTVEFNWDDLNLEPQTLYNVIINYSESYESYNNGEKSPIEGNWWYLTTELFNSCYMSSSSDFIDNYIKFTLNDNSLEDREKLIKNDKLTLKYKITNNIIDNSKDLEEVQTGNLFSKTQFTNNKIEITCINTCKVDLQTIPILSLENPLLYPKHLNIQDQLANLESIDLSDNNNIILYKSDNDLLNSLIDYSDISSENNIIKGDLIYKDIFKSQSNSSTSTISIENGFARIDQAIEEILNIPYNKTTLMPMFRKVNNANNNHYVVSPRDNSEENCLYQYKTDTLQDSPNSIITISEDGSDQDYLVIKTKRADMDITFKAKDCLEELQSEMKDSIFTYCYTTPEEFDLTNQVYNTSHGRSEIDPNRIKSSRKKARMWWKGENSLVLLYGVLNKDDNEVFKTELLKYFPNNLYYCLYINGVLNLYTYKPGTENYNNPYDFTLVIKLNIKKTPDNITNNGQITFQNPNSVNLIDYYLIKKSSSDNLQSIISNRDSNELKNVTIDSIQSVDSYGNALRSNQIYQEVNGKLTISSFPVIVREYKNNINALYYNDNRKGTYFVPKYQYDTIVDLESGDNDSTVHIDYSGVTVIRQINNTDNE